MKIKEIIINDNKAVLPGIDFEIGELHKQDTYQADNFVEEDINQVGNLEVDIHILDYSFVEDENYIQNYYQMA